jgi:hypothetical protein
VQVATKRVQPLLLARGQPVFPLTQPSSACLGRRIVRLDRHTLLHDEAYAKGADMRVRLLITRPLVSS